MKKKLFEHLGGNKFRLSESTSRVYKTTYNHPETDEEIPITGEYDYYPEERGSRERGTGLQIEPDEPATVEITSVKDNTGNEVELSTNDIQRIEDEIFDDVKSYGDYD